MTPEKERRSYDQTITDILVEMKGTRKDIEYIKEAVPQIWDNKDDIIAIKTNQKGMIKAMWAVGIVTLSVTGRLIYKAFHS